MSKKERELWAMRHSAEHVLTQAMFTIYGHEKIIMAMGPATEEGFYFDFDSPEGFKISEEDFPKIEKEMQKIVAADLPFKKKVLSVKEARKLFKGNPYKQEWLDEIALRQAQGKKEKVVVYWTGDEFVDLCGGPHVASTGKIGPFKLLSVAGAYWRGDEKNKMLTRIYGTAFKTEKALDEYLKMHREAEKRDHRKLGKEHDLYSISEEVGPGLILWHPKGAFIRNILEDYWREKHKEGGYQFVFTPHIGRSALWEKSGHLKWYKENMYSAIDIEGDEYYLKPMNCPFHMMIYESRTRSYRDLPMRWAELGTVYRYERSGVLHGMTRVRGFTQDDAHIFCTPEQIEKEMARTLKFCLDFLKVFGLPMSAELSVRDPATPKKYAGSDKEWKMAETVLVKALKANRLAYKRMEGEAVFYGPKIDIKAYDALGRPWQISTIQFDFNIPERFNLSFTNKEGKKQAPYVVHRALYGALERFFPILVEHYAGAFPVWLAPVQAVVIPISEKFLSYAEKVAKELKEAHLRVEVDDRDETMQAKIRDAQLQKIPYMFIVGEKEKKSGGVAVRLRNGKDLGAKKIPPVKKKLLEMVASRSLDLW